MKGPGKNKHPFSGLANSGVTAAMASDPAGRDGKCTSLAPDIFFSCNSIEDAAVLMRRRVQLGIGLEVFGTQLCNYLNYSDLISFAHAMNTCYFENSAGLLALHVAAMWWYYAFLRDALMARHVTGIAMSTPSVQSTYPGSDIPEVLGVVNCMVRVETGPWTREIELSQPRINSKAEHDEVDMLRTEVPLASLFQLGMLHADQVRGEVFNPVTLDQVLNGNLVVGSEEITMDMFAVRRAFVNPEKVMPFLADGGISESSDNSNGFVSSIQKNEWLEKT